MYPDAETFLRVQSFMLAAESMNVRESYTMSGRDIASSSLEVTSSVETESLPLISNKSEVIISETKKEELQQMQDQSCLLVD